MHKGLLAILMGAALAMAACGDSSGAGTTAGASTGGAPSGGDTSKGGSNAPDFTARDVQGKTVRLSDHLGKEVILLDFWSTYCEPCKAEFPHLRELYETRKGKGFVLMAVAMDGPETVAEVPAFAKRYGMNFPVVLDEDSRIASLYNPKKSMPLSVLIDRQGRIAVVREGYNPGDEQLVMKDVDKALDQATSAK